MLSELQQSRIKYHLDITYSSAFEEVDANFRLMLSNLPPERELAIVGDQTNLDYDFLGTPLCTTGSALWKCEASLAKLNPDTIDPSLFVVEADGIALRGDEERRRRRLYEAMVGDLRRLFDISEPKTGLGYWGLGK